MAFVSHEATCTRPCDTGHGHFTHNQHTYCSQVQGPSLTILAYPLLLHCINPVMLEKVSPFTMHVHAPNSTTQHRNEMDLYDIKEGVIIFI